MSRTMKRAIAVTISAGLAVTLVWGFLVGREEATREREREQPVKAPSRVSVESGEVVVAIDAETLARSGIQIAELQATTRPRTVPAYGAVLGVGRLTAAQTGYAAAKAQAGKVGASLDASRREYERVKTLHKANQNVSARVLEAAQAAFRADEATFESAQADLKAQSATIEQDWGKAIASWLFDDDRSLTSLLARQDVLIQVTLPADQSEARAPETARVHGTAGPGVEARLVSVASRTDPRIQGLTLYYLAPASSRLLPGMSVVADLPIGEASAGLIVPRSAVVWFQASAWVYLQTGPTEFSRRMVATDMPAEGGFLVTGLPQESRAVVAGAQLLLSEEARAQIQVLGEEGE